MSMKDEFFRKIEERKAQEDSDIAYWEYVYSLVNDYTPEKVEDFLERLPGGKVTEKEIDKFNKLKTLAIGATLASIGLGGFSLANVLKLFI